MTASNPPAVLYRYFPFAPFIEKVISGESIRFSNPLAFNDPFEVRPGLYFDPDVPETSRYHHQVARKRGMSVRERLSKIQAMNNRLRRAGGRDVSPDVVRLHMGSYGVLCLTPHRDNLLMWAHYGDSHAGVCLGFDTSVHIFRVAMEVRYQEAYPEVRPAVETNEEGLEKTILTKAPCWAYESEWRIVKPTLSEAEQHVRREHYRLRVRNSDELDMLVNQRGPGDYRFNKTALREIIIGARASAEVRSTLARWVREHNSEVRLYQAACHDREFSLVINPLE